MAELTTAARPYARAAYEAAKQDDLGKWFDALNALAQIMQDDSGKSIFNDVRYSTHQLEEIIKSLLDDVISDTKVWNFIRLLVANRRLVLIDKIVYLFEQYMLADQQIVRAEVISAFPLDDAQQESIRSSLAKRTGQRAEITCSVDSALLGGAIVRMGDLVIDASIRMRIGKFSAVLTA